MTSGLLLTLLGLRRLPPELHQHLCRSVNRAGTFLHRCCDLGNGGVIALHELSRYCV